MSQARTPHDAKLPLDTLRIIFEEVAKTSGWEAYQLLFVSKDVTHWVQPILYTQTIFLSSSEQARGFIEAASSASDISRSHADRVTAIWLVCDPPAHSSSPLNLQSFPNVEELACRSNWLVRENRFLRKREGRNSLKWIAYAVTNYTVHVFVQLPVNAQLTKLHLLDVIEPDSLYIQDFGESSQHYDNVTYDIVDIKDYDKWADAEVDVATQNEILQMAQTPRVYFKVDERWSSSNTNTSAISRALQILEEEKRIRGKTKSWKRQLTKATVTLVDYRLSGLCDISREWELEEGAAHAI